MLFPRTLFGSLLLVLAPWVGQAQTPDAPARAHSPQVFVGVGGLFAGCPLPKGGAVNLKSFVPTLGVQLRPRWGVEVSAAYDTDYRHTRASYETLDPSTGQWVVDYGTRTSRIRALLVPVLARYALLNRPAQRFQVDVLGGLSLVHAVARQSMTAGSGEPYELGTSRATGVCLTLGPSVRYQVGAGLQVTAEAVLNRQVQSPRRLHAANPSVSAGVRYSFGSRP
ncbi:outer membrane insertion C-terminal signal [Hymenobacter roseosalivarius DSM 11622]|uniref:Outer membrane insertion C-terminal signal n=1 Tax=Hymenobacter roseosalivarius DSM 11622 TaxID=645990 RepID=A0A1W1W577_9BACT|nr:hypothetical protein [Hymenobacter roseosalivarius]SMC00693.1 outer membrane insertion C-terminal signal [Hymenobacter roseosalivarius DSM 11622]